ncbi:MAG: DDE-type integrase/transposase/recombinase [Hyphomicrobiales bacterium]|nr:DDE-type integrase/transposase/recombinase [Hyphomicrobiales bacterium]MDE2113858.1 transposase [Hyphomicrobiales bacterium]
MRKTPQPTSWYSAAELAGLHLPGLPTTARRMADFIAREGWDADSARARPRLGRGGGMEYRLDLIPTGPQLLLAARATGEAPLPMIAAAAAEPGAEALNAAAASARDARLAIVHAANAYVAGYPRGALANDTAALALFVALYNARSIKMPASALTEVPNLSLRSLQRWIAATRSANTSALAVDRGAARRGRGTLDSANDGAVKLHILALTARQPHLSAHHIMTMVRDQFGDRLEVEGTYLPVPPLRTFQSALKAWKTQHHVALTAITNPDAYKSKFRLAGTATDRFCTAINALWMIDASPADVLCLDGRSSVYVAIDLFSRRLQIYVSKTPRASAVALLIRRAIAEWGMPDAIKTDNGSDFVARDIVRLFAALNIETITCRAFHPEEKAHVERAIGTFQRDLCPTLPGFIGHSVKDRKVIEERKAFAARLGLPDDRTFCVELTASELQAYCDRWANERYQHRPHAGLDGATPFAIAQRHAAQVRAMPELRALDMLLTPVASGNGLRIMGKQGVRIEGDYYLCPHVLPGTETLVRMDPNDMGRALLFTPDGAQYLGEAVCPTLAGVDPVAAVQAAKQAQAEILFEGTRHIRAQMRRIKPRDMVDAMLRQSARDNGTLVPFPAPLAAYETPQLQAASQAASHVASNTASQATTPTSFLTFDGSSTPASAADIAALAAQVEADAMAAASNVIALPERPIERYRRAFALEEAMSRGEPVDPEAALWLGRYQTSAEYLTHSQMFASFGRDWLFA